ncbi:MAG: DUF2818 family protein [Burkholderiaceae bacterium]
MTQTMTVWLVILVAALVANLPFITQKLFLFVALAKPKTGWWRLVELVVFYFVVGGLGLLLENRAGQIAPQGWEFYATTAALFVTLAFPGFIYRYLLKHH